MHVRQRSPINVSRAQYARHGMVWCGAVWCGVARPGVELQIRSKLCSHPDPEVQSASSSALVQSRTFIDLHNCEACGQVKLCWQPPNPAKSDSTQRASPKQVFCMYPLIAVLEQHLTS